MSIEFWDSFDTYTDPLTWWTQRAGNPLPTITAGTGRFGTSGLEVGNTNTVSWIAKTLSAVQTRIIAVSFRCNVLPDPGQTSSDILGFADSGSAQFDLRVTSNGRLAVTRNGTVLATTTFAISPFQTYHIQLKVKIDPSVGTVDLKVNDVSLISLTGQNTRNTANSTSDEIYLGARFRVAGFNVGGWRCYYDDLVVLNDSGAVNNDFPGDVRVQSTLPTGAGTTTNFNPSAGSNYQNVDDNPPNDDTDYNYSGIAGDVDTYAMGDITSTSGSVLGVASRMRVKKDDAGAKTIAGAIHTNSNDYFGSDQAIGTTYSYYAKLWETNPNTTNPFTVAEVNAIEAGIKIIS